MKDNNNITSWREYNVHSASSGDDDREDDGQPPIDIFASSHGNGNHNNTMKRFNMTLATTTIIHPSLYSKNENMINRLECQSGKELKLCQPTCNKTLI